MFVLAELPFPWAVVWSSHMARRMPGKGKETNAQ
jgi:hypothetical protein